MRKSLITLSIITALLAGCGSDNDKSKETAEIANTSPQSMDVTYNVAQAIQITGQLEGTDAEGNMTFSLVNSDDVKLGVFDITDASTGQFTYVTDALEGTETISFKVSDGESESISTLTIQITGGDPLYPHQWHLSNTAQNSFAINRGVAGEDMNVNEAITSGVKGQGVIVAVVDTGLEINHPDLKANVVSGGSYNLITGTVDPTSLNDGYAHGTAVGGIIAAAGWNGMGGRGVAPEAKLIGFNFLDSDPDGVENAQSFENFVMSHGATAYSDSARVFNQSYGYSVPFPDLFNENETEVYAETTVNSFDGKGSIFVKSAGNGYNYFSYGGVYWLPADYFTARDEGKAANNGLPFHNSNMTASNADVYNLVVSAINASGELSSYSSVGANIFVTAPGGEYGTDFPAIVTADRSGCDKGYVISADRPNTPFHGGDHPLNLECDYMSTMNGTSSAAPNTTGAVAMIMSANPDLTWRDVRHILASTSTKVNADKAPINVSLSDTQEYEAVPAWFENAAGFSFHDFYGFGRVDVSAAVKAAQSYETDLGEYVLTDWINSAVDLNKTIPDASLVGVSDFIEVKNDMIVEAVQIQLSADHLRIPDLAVELISPAGTRSVIMTPYNGLVYQGVMDTNNTADIVTGYVDTPMLSNAFYGESTKGEWTLKLIDVNSGEYSFMRYNIDTVEIENEDSGQLQNWSIRFHGHDAESKS
ncbi:S8 family serine peptidase [Shewanella surugensis]|uniref:S8 family serine peptidase n=1 Tax=Shewanella surugensis TaxID=212020 RepID=A0ABT0L6N0_9GAMM|nr:S8 family serine peptidase [Shewanella surugensis]MCL1123347.1 S8 family serine peptidase [Shewanella surugensis]